MIETEADEYKLNSETHQQSLRISLINNEKIAMILINKLTNQRYSSYLSLQNLKQLSQAFAKVNNIKDALTILKTTIESGNISLIEDTKDSSMSINYEITLDSMKYPEFEVNLTLEESQTNTPNEKGNLELTSSLNYQETAEGNAKITTEYSKPIIDSNIKPPIVQLEYIEPILQVHYPDGTTKSTALPPRIQGADGEKANISEEQFKLIQAEIKKNTVSAFDINDNNVNINRANSAVLNDRSRYSTQSTPYPSSNNMAKKNPFGNQVRSAIQKSNSNINTINQVRSAFSSNPNLNKLNSTGILNKTSSNYSTMSTPYNRPFTSNNPNAKSQNNFNNTALYGNSQYFIQTHNPRNVIEERRPRMTNINPNMQRNTERSLSTPGRYNNFNNNLSQLNNRINIDNNQSQPYNQNFNNTSSNVYARNQMSQINTQGQIRTNNSATALKQSQELIQSHQKRIQEIQRQLALIQQQHNNLIQEQKRQLMLQQQLKGQINKKNTYTNNPQFNTISNPNSSNLKKFKGFAQVNQIDRKGSNASNSQIRQAQTSTNNQYYNHQASQEIKPSKTFLGNNSNPPYKTQISNPLSLQAPKLETQYSNNNIEDEIPNQYIALAQMASMQNQQNPEYQNLNAITLQQKVEESHDIQEENQVQQEQETANEQAQQQGEEQEELDIEALFMTEEGRIIFRNGLLRGIIHKYAEIDDVISKIQDILLKGVKFNLVYKAFDVGDKAETFHEKCDKLKMSLILIETDKDIRFGGFTMKSWEGNNLKKIDNNAFVFSLETNSIFDVIKNEPAIGCYPKYGPVFFGCQIRIYDEFFTKGGTTCHKGLNFKTKKDYELNNGEQKYLIKDIEVYGIEAIDV